MSKPLAVSNFMKLSFKKIAVIAAIVLIMTALLTSVMTWANHRNESSFLIAWLPSWGFSLLVMVPFGYLAMLVVSRFVASIASMLSEFQQNLLTGMLMAVVMESIMAMAVAIRLTGFSSALPQYWVTSLLAGLPIALIFSVFMTITLKPWLERYLAS